jgi:hypothetical protein
MPATPAHHKPPTCAVSSSKQLAPACPRLQHPTWRLLKAAPRDSGGAHGGAAACAHRPAGCLRAPRHAGGRCGAGGAAGGGVGAMVPGSHHLQSSHVSVSGFTARCWSRRASARWPAGAVAALRAPWGSGQLAAGRGGGCGCACVVQRGLRLRWRLLKEVPQTA